jgi:hypothetical protein
MAKKAQTWEDLLAAHDKWMLDYNFQRHMAHEERQDHVVCMDSPKHTPFLPEQLMWYAH